MRAGMRILFDEAERRGLNCSFGGVVLWRPLLRMLHDMMFLRLDAAACGRLVLRQVLRRRLVSRLHAEHGIMKMMVPLLEVKLGMEREFIHLRLDAAMLGRMVLRRVPRHAGALRRLPRGGVTLLLMGHGLVGAGGAGAVRRA